MSHLGAALFGVGEFMHHYEVSSTKFAILLDHVGQIGDGSISDAPAGSLTSTASFSK